jgi:hypothetical protein
MRTPVALCIFNRPQTTERVFAAIAAAKPPMLLVVADGPRPDHPGEAEKCAAARAIIERVDWPCEVRTNFAETNMGARFRMASGITWVFEQVEEAIILEDDVLAHPTFFQFCDELLEKYRDDERVGYIGGHNVLFGRRTTPYSYYFAATLNGWGWASWRRAWKYYDVYAKLWAEIRDQGQIPSLLYGKPDARATRRFYEWSYRGEMENYWDVQWDFACRAQHMLTIIPSVPLTENIGLGADSTTTIFQYKLATLHAQPMEFPLSHPPYMFHDAIAERIAVTAAGVPWITRAAVSRLNPRTIKRLQGLIRRAIAIRNRVRERRAKRAA